MGRLSDMFGRKNKAEGSHIPSKNDSSPGRDGENLRSTLGSLKKTREKYGLFIIHQPLDQGLCNFDVVAVHGLGGDWEGTWTDKSTGKMWLRDFLPQQFPNARVMSFGYDSAYALSTSVSDIDGAAMSLIDRLIGERQQAAVKRRPIVFIAHSLGGIVVKRALIITNERSDHWKDVRDSAAGVMFFAVPHKGADTAYWANLATNVLSFTTLGAVGNSRFVKGLKRNSPEFSNISQAFVQPAARFTVIRTFYETDKIANQLIVDKDSASLNVGNELAIPIHGANHRNICLFGGSESQKYRPVYNALQMMFEQLETYDNAFIQERARIYSQYIRDEWQSKVVDAQHIDEDLNWIIYLSRYRRWKGGESNELLYVEHDWDWEWYGAMARVVERDLRQTGSELIYVLRHSGSQDESPDEDIRLSLGRSLLAQIISNHPGCLDQVNDIQIQLQARAVDSWQDRMRYANGELVPWKTSFCSPNAVWQHVWSLLACAIESLPNSIIIILVGVQEDWYSAFNDGSRYLDCFFNGLAKRIPNSLHYLFIGTADHHANGIYQLLPLHSYNTISKETEIEECHSSLYFPGLHARRDRVEKSKQGTSQWIWTHPMYSAWHSQESSLLWIYGKPGSGKSTLAAMLQRSLIENEHDFIVADYFYSARGGPTERSHTLMLQSLLYQLLKKEPRLYPYFQTFFRRLRGSGPEDISWPYLDLQKILLSLANTVKITSEAVKPYQFLFLLDGLDESEDTVPNGPQRHELFRLISLLCSTESINTFKIIALSRAELDITGALQASYSIDMKDTNYADIEKIVRAGMADIWGQMTRDQTDPHRVEKKSATGDSGENHLEDSNQNTVDIPELGFLRDHLLKYADGVILWVVMILRELMTVAKSGACTKGQLRSMLSKIPTSLEALYHDILHRVENGPYSDPERAKYVFYWLLFGDRTLTVAELRDALAMSHWDESKSVNDESFLENNRVLQLANSWQPTWTHLTNLCGNFIEIVPINRSPSEKLWRDRLARPDDSVQLIHQTTKDFLLYHSRSQFLNPDPLIGTEIISKACIEYLSMTLPLYRRSSSDLKLMSVWDTVQFDKFVRLLEDRPLLVYVLGHIPLHVGRRSYGKLEEYLRSLEAHPSSIAWSFLFCWIHHNTLLPASNQRPSPVTERQESWQPGKKQDERSVISMAMWFACKAGALNAVRIILAADPGWKKNKWGSIIGIDISFCAAAENGHHEIVKLLLEYGFAADVKDASGDTALHLAVMGGHVLVVEELLKVPTLMTLSTKNHQGVTALDLSMMLGQDQITKILSEVEEEEQKSPGSRF